MVFAVDLLLVSFSYWISFHLRFDFTLPPEHLPAFQSTFLIVVAARMAAFYYFDLYRGFWRYASLTDLTSIFKAIISSQVVIAALVFFLRHGIFPRSVLIIDPILALILVGGIRFVIRSTREFRSSPGQDAVKTLIFGAGDLGESVLRDFMREKGLRRRIVGFLDDDKKKWGRKIHGVPIIGGRSRLDEVVRRHGVEEVVIAVNHSRGKLISELVALFRDGDLLKKVQIKTIPTLSEMLAHDPSSRKWAAGMRKIELSDLLNRKPVKTDMEPVSELVKGRTILVTGAGGTIGAELSRQILNFKPAKLVLLENHNTALFYIDKELSEKAAPGQLETVAGDVKDTGLLENIFRTYKPNLVFHAAAHKHVPLMEGNPQEAVKNNTLATHSLARTAAAHGVDRFLYIST
ncbi:MAG TPA: polysaccharide biosynthesis protein, partial [Elusimicrobiales bacterium]|nr:polysaccharide biosynthesis protein [Elusimicrobiales bacterium]